MEITINTEEKTIRLNEPVNLSELTKFIKDLFKDDWKEWSIENSYSFSTLTVPYNPNDITYLSSLTNK